MANDRREQKEKWRESKRRWIENNREWVNESNKRWRDNNKDKVREIQRRYHESHKEEIARKARLKRASNPELFRMQNSVRTRRRQKELRKLVIERFGGKCVRCGFDDERALQIDHVDGGGHKDSRRTGYNTLLKKVLVDEQGKYQLLCANCNQIKKVERNEIYRRYL